jgi:hypothetical protein
VGHPSTEKAIHRLLLVLNNSCRLLPFHPLIPHHIHLITQDTLVIDLGYEPRRFELSESTASGRI